MKDFEKIFKEYLILNESRINSPKREFKDVYLGGNHLLRSFGNTSIIYFLTTSDSIVIPNIYLDLFTGFNTEYSGLISELLEKENSLENRISKTIRYLLQLSREIQSNLLFYKTDSILSYIEKIVNLGCLKDIRRIVNELTGLIIDPWKIENLNQTVDI